ncbi:MAG: hypothetical protein Q4C77_12065 [Eubacteriales bacterium]|nr:hypothetical protein [Eubacteriales bacterium]
MQKNGVILLIILLCVAFLVSCGKRDTAEQKQGELVKIETEGEWPLSLFSFSGRNTYFD